VIESQLRAVADALEGHVQHLVTLVDGLHLQPQAVPGRPAQQGIGDVGAAGADIEQANGPAACVDPSHPWVGVPAGDEGDKGPPAQRGATQPAVGSGHVPQVVDEQVVVQRAVEPLLPIADATHPRSVAPRSPGAHRPPARVM
jgi:hypothetical protein